MTKIILIIPAYNEEGSILKTYKSVEKYNKKSKEKLDVIVINDGSKDNTAKILDDNNIPHVNLIHNLGIGGAVQTGYKYAYNNDYDIAIQFDGDGQHDVNYVKDLVEPIINKKANMVIGSRFINKEEDGFKSSRARRLGIKLISSFIKLKTKKKIYDVTSGFRAVDKKLMSLFVEHYPTEYPEPISTVKAIKNEFEVTEVPVKMKEREEGKSSISSWRNIYYMINVIITIIIMSKDHK